MIFFSGILIGLVGSLHCVSMCGPLVMALNYKQKGFFKNLLYHTGRLLSYMSLGALFGLVGQGISLAGVQQWLSILAGLIIIAITILPRLKVNYFQAKWQQVILAPMKRKLLKAVNDSRAATLFTLGFLNGLLPCGLVYVAIAAALALGSAWDSALLMAGFGIATWPLMLSVALGSNWILTRFRSKLNYAIPFVALLMGTLLILRGMALDIPYVSPVLASVFGEEITICR